MSDEMISTNPTTLIFFLVMAIAVFAFLLLHWRYHPAQTKLDSFAALEKRLRQGKPILIQFHAPL